jgi:hypothetical protein
LEHSANQQAGQSGMANPTPTQNEDQHPPGETLSGNLNKQG